MESERFRSKMGRERVRRREREEKTIARVSPRDFDESSKWEKRKFFLFFFFFEKN